MQRSRPKLLTLLSLLGAPCLLGVTLSSAPLQAQQSQPARSIYSWVDAYGQIHFVDEPALIPAGYVGELEVEVPEAQPESSVAERSARVRRQRLAGDVELSLTPEQEPPAPRWPRDERLALGRDRRYWETRSADLGARHEAALLAVRDADLNGSESTVDELFQALEEAESELRTARDEARRNRVPESWLSGMDE